MCIPICTVSYMWYTYNSVYESIFLLEYGEGMQYG